MDQSRLDEIRARWAATTPGVWIFDEDCKEITTVDGQPVIGVFWYDEPLLYIKEEDAAFVMSAHTDIPDLLAEVERLTELVGRDRSMWCENCEMTGRENNRLLTEVERLTRELDDPVRHGRWIAWNGERPVWLGCFCSVCKNHADSKFAFCPNCGARMDAENGGAE